MIIFIPITLNICFGCSKEPSHRDGSFEYPQHMFWLRNKIFVYASNELNETRMSLRRLYNIEPWYEISNNVACLHV